MSALRIIIQMMLLLGGSYLWMRYFSFGGKMQEQSKPVRMVVLSGVGMVMMIVALSGFSHQMLGLLGFASGGSGGSILWRIVVGSLFSGVTAGLACLLMRMLLSRSERAVRAGKGAGSSAGVHAGNAAKYVNDPASG